MHTSSFASFLLQAALLTTVTGRPSACKAALQPGKAVYLITNDRDNAVVGLRVLENGMLSGGAVASTQGSGSNFVDGMTKQPAAPDALASQSALTVAGKHLFAVNAGSNTITMFTIDPADPTKLTMAGQPAAVPGEFPNTVAANKKHQLVCVGTSGAKAGVSCASFSERGIGAMDALRPIDLKQTTPPAGPTNTLSQAFFSNDEKTLFVTVKGDPTKQNAGFLAAYQVDNGNATAGLSLEGTRSSPNGTAVLFGSSTIPGSSDLFVTDASFGAAVLSVHSSPISASIKGMGKVADQKATCWATISAATKTAFVTDVGKNRLIEMSVQDASIQGVIDLSSNGDPGLIDLRAAGNFIYALSPGNGTTQAAITVVDALSKKQIQHFNLGCLGAGKNAQGMEVFL
ncbi:3-carboxymuconate cyclase [Colletotrichum musicola]|uniref:3-carboxymuconate cyclase n=1 Tax=Colletotrichum musicola TaxID=2175873 RepID=A0A8H6KK24_9PEZI|nr:3-carboxymuconate cyclase [Colletotrichum musicola]